MSTDDKIDRRFYGRRHGHTLRAGPKARLAEVLPLLQIDTSVAAPTDIAGLFDKPVREIWLEIGFGTGEHLAWQAAQNRDVGLIGAEPFINGLSRFVTHHDEAGLDNVRIHADDARPLLDWLPPGSIGRTFILFPDPWPKKKHQRRRIVSVENLARLARIMRPGGELLVATDIGDYARSTLVAVFAEKSFRWIAADADDWRQKQPHWPPSRYEEKALAAGRSCAYLRFQRRRTPES